MTDILEQEVQQGDLVWAGLSSNNSMMDLFVIQRMTSKTLRLQSTSFVYKRRNIPIPSFDVTKHSYSSHKEIIKVERKSLTEYWTKILDQFEGRNI